MFTHTLTNRLCEPQPDKPYVRRPWALVETEAEILATFDQRNPGPHAVAFQQLEHHLGTLFAVLSLADARELHRRLSNPAPDDPIAAKFSRMVVERRQRLVAFLADAPRRAAIGRR